MSLARTPCRVLVVTATFPPEGAVGGLRTLRLLKHLARTGTAVEVVTLSPDTYRSGTVTDPALLSHIPAGVQVVRARALRPFERLGRWLRGGRRARAGDDSRPSGRRAAPAQGSAARIAFRRWRTACSAVLGLPDREASWILPAVIAAFRSARRNGPPDVIYSSGPPFSAHLAAAALARALKKPWVADFRDPWARAPWREDRFRFEKRAWSILERLVVARADALVFVTEANRADFAEHYRERPAHCFHVVPNGCDPADFNGLVEQQQQSARFVLLHAGSLYGARDPSPLFTAVADCVANGTVDKTRFRIRLIGRIGMSGVDLPGLIRSLDIEEVVEFVPHLPRRTVLQEMVDASALLVVQPVTKVSVPGKLYEYLAAGRPILALAEPEGDTAALVRRSKAGVVVSPADRTGIQRALLRLLEADSCRLEIDRTLYDGAIRAAELGGILRRIASETQVQGAPSRSLTIPTKGS